MTNIKSHPDYKNELEQLDKTKEYFDKFIEQIEKNTENYQSEIREAFVQLDFLDSSQSYITILTNAKLMDTDKENLEKVEKTKLKPYFSRIDFAEQGSNKTRSYYIGKLSLLNEEQEPIVIDWRSPVASLYYDGKLGEVTYEANHKEIQGELQLKRQYQIESGQLQDFFDVDITATDELLQASLATGADSRLKDIAATIQSEQNKIIRAPFEKPLIVQGVAGSGKTTIALHRIAYLIYTYEKEFIPENFMIMAPNNLFLNYISEVLPDLGVERVNQTTYVDFCMELLDIDYELQDPFSKLVVMLEDKNDDNELLRWCSKYKGSMEYKKAIDRLLAHIEAVMVPQKACFLEEYCIASKEELAEMFSNQYSYRPLLKRVEQIKNNLKLKLKNKKTDIIRDIEDYYEREIEIVRNKKETEVEAEDEVEFEAKAEVERERRQQLIGLMDERDNKLEKIKKSARSLVQKYVGNYKNKDTLSYYKKLLTDKKLFQQCTPGLDEKQREFLRKHSLELVKEKKLEIEDLPALTYLKAKLEGFEERLDIENVVIDEGQDFSLFQFYSLRYILSTDSFTVLGDLSQGINSHRGVDNWQEVKKFVFPNSEVLTLKQSYRTTVEIMELANLVLQESKIKDLVLAEPVVRYGDKPEIVEFSDTEQLIAQLASRVKEAEQKYGSLAIIAKTNSECLEISKKLQPYLQKDVPVMSGGEDQYDVGLMIVPVYLAKGLEFDAVFVCALEEEYLPSRDLDCKLLYVAMTRAMHKLSVYSLEKAIAIKALSN